MPFDLHHGRNLKIRKNLSPLLYKQRRKPSEYPKSDACSEFLSDHSRIVFSSSFRRLVKKAQVFSLESNTSVRNRLTHSLEVADTGRTIARKVGNGLKDASRLKAQDIPCLISIVENACLLHDIGNPPFGHFGEIAIQRWFQNLVSDSSRMPFRISNEDVYDLVNFDGNPQGFRIATRLHCERDKYSFNLTHASLLASIKYPHTRKPLDGTFRKKIGVFGTEEAIYREICSNTGHEQGKRYFLAYLMELADDCSYCLSDIADSFEKKIISFGEYQEVMREICVDKGVDSDVLLGRASKPSEFNFKFDVAIPVTKKIIDEGTDYFVQNINEFVSGRADELTKIIDSGKYLACIKRFARRLIYPSLEVERIELAGFHIVNSLLDQFGKILAMDRTEFSTFVVEKEVPEGSSLDFEWRLFNRLSKRMLKAYEYMIEENTSNKDEWLARAKLVVDFIAGMTDDSAKELHQILTGTNSVASQGAW